MHQIGEYDRVTGAVTYQPTVDEGEPKLTLSFTGPLDGVGIDLGYGMFRYTPNPRVNAHSDTFTVIADDGRGGSLDSTVTWVNANHVPVAVAPPTVWPADPTTGAVRCFRISFTPTVIGWPSRSTSRCRSAVR